MRFNSLDLYRLVSFKFAQIERLELDFAADVQVVLGTNGCGKSSLLRELAPLPSPRTSFEPGGYKKLIISHHGHEYQLTSDYGNKTSPHSFQKDGIELNSGGTTHVQEELVIQELGYTDDVAALVTGTHDFAKMPAGMRKSLLINLNPCQIGFVLDYHKNVSSKIRACKANLTMLQERKFALEQEFLPDTQRDLLYQERQRLQRDIEVFIEFIHRTDERLQNFENAVSVTVPFSTESADQRVREVFRGYHKFSKYRDVPRTDQSDYEKNLLRTIAQYDGRLTGLQEQLRDVVELRNADHAILAELDAAAIELQAELRLHARQTELAQLKDHICAHPASLEILQLWESVGPQFHDLCHSFLDCGVNIRSPDYLYKRRQNVKHCQYVFQENQLELKRIGEEVTRIQLAQKIKLEDIPNTPCAKHHCPLYSQFRDAYDRRAAQLQQLTQRHDLLQRHTTRLQHYLTQRTLMLTNQEQFAYPIQKLCSYYQQLGETVPDNMYTLLNQDPLVLYRNLNERMQASSATHRYRQLLAEAEHDQWKDSTRSQIAEDEKERLRARVSMYDAKYQTLLDRITIGSRKVDQLKQQHSVLLEYQTLLAQLQNEYAQLSNTVDLAWRYHNKTELERLLTQLKNHRDTAIRRLGEIDHVLQEQTQLHTRYNEEVVHQLKRLEQEKTEWLWIEASLARIPVNYTVVFINSILSVMNQAIAKVFSYPFYLLPITAEQPLDYRFSAQVGDVTIADISMCSDAQKEIINLTFRLALIKQLGLQDYPIHLDEVGRAFDTYHKQRLLELVRDIMDQHYVSQMFLVNHHALIHEGLTNADILVLSDSNILTPPVYNTHVVFNRAN